MLKNKVYKYTYRLTSSQQDHHAPGIGLVYLTL